MPEWLVITFLYGVGVVLLIAELFLPAHGLLGLVGAGVLGYGIYGTFAISQLAGIIGLVAVAIALPTGLVIAVNNWHRTPVGRRISPPNPRLTEKDRMPVEDLKPFIGMAGRSLTPLRPVGTCLFDGRRVECTAEQGMINKGVEVVGLRLVDRTLSVRPIDGNNRARGSQAT